MTDTGEMGQMDRVYFGPTLGWMFVTRPYITDQSSVRVTRNSVNGGTDIEESVLVTTIVPASAMGPSGRVRISAIWSYTSSSVTKTLKVKFGDVVYHSEEVSVTQAFTQVVAIANRGAVNSQIGTSGFGPSAIPFVTSSINTNLPVNVEFSCVWGGAALEEAISLESYLVEVFHGS